MDPHGWEVREFMRKQFLGKRLRAVMTGGYMKRDYAMVYGEMGLVQEILISNGFAELTEPIVGKDIPESDRERLNGLETKAKSAKVGIWSETPPPEVPVTDMAPFSAREIAMTYFQQIQNKKIVGVIERITSGSKFVVYSPEEKAIIRVNVNKVKPYSVRDRFGVQTKEYAKTHYLQCNVELVPIEVDKSGSFRSEMTITLRNGTSVNIAEDLVGQGMAEIFTYLVAQGEAPDRLLELQERAIAAGVGVWADKTRHKRRLFYDRVEPVTVVSVWDPVTLSVQFINETRDKIFATLHALAGGMNPPPVVEKPMESDCVLIQRENVYLRGSIENLDESTAEVRLLDVVGDKVTVPLSQLYVVPPVIANLEPQLRTVYLGCCKPTDETTPAMEAIWTACRQKQLYLYLMYEDEGSNVLLTDKPAINAGSLNDYLISQGLVKFVPHRVPPQFNDVLQLFEKSQLQAPQPAATE